MLNRSQRSLIHLAKPGRMFSTALSTNTEASTHYNVVSLMEFSNLQTAKKVAKTADDADYFEKLRLANTQHGAYTKLEGSPTDSAHIKKIKAKINSIVA